MQEIKVCDIRIAECPSNGKTVVRKLQKGDSFFIASKERVRIGDSYSVPCAIITEIFYEPRKWWQFWKKKKQLGFMVTVEPAQIDREANAEMNGILGGQTWRITMPPRDAHTGFVGHPS